MNLKSEMNESAESAEIAISQIQYNAWVARRGVNRITCYLYLDGTRSYRGVGDTAALRIAIDRHLDTKAH